MRTGGRNGDRRRNIRQDQIVIDRIRELIRSNIARAFPIVGASRAALVGRGALGYRDLVNGRAATEQGDGLRGTTVVRKPGGQLRIDVLMRGTGGEAATAVIREVVASVAHTPRAVAVRVTDQDAATEMDRATIVPKDATAGAGAGSRIVGEGAVADIRHAAIDEDAGAGAAVLLVLIVTVALLAVSAASPVLFVKVLFVMVTLPPLIWKPLALPLTPFPLAMVRLMRETVLPTG